MPLRLLVDDDIVYEGESIPIPRVGDHLRHNGMTVPIEAVTWDLGEGAVVVHLVVGSKPYTY